ncbi:MAG: hypothetical protein RLY77_610 [Pseudomonadota bacterium]|jgi:catecholate siderophore receptor
MASALITSLTLALPMLAHAATDNADTDKDKSGKKPEAVTLDKVQVRGSWFNPSSSKFTAELLDTPKTVSIVTEKLLEETGATNLQDALRMVPGLTFGAGEGGNPTGDRPFIRGFDGQSNTFVDGMRDVGMQTREVFNLEQVEVVKGPSSAYGGRDSGGGSINLVSKTPKLKDETRISLGLGTDNYQRETVDSNIVLGDGIAARLNLMKHASDISGRDAANVSRWGVAPSIGFGLNGDAQLILSHYHMETDDLPDAGGFPYNNPFSATSPYVSLNGDGSPSVPNRNNYYGLKDRDFQRTESDISTIDASLAFGEHKIRNVVRIARSSNDYLWTQPDDSKGNPLVNNSLWRRINSRSAVSNTFADQLSLSGHFNTGPITHSYSAGIEYSDEKTHRGSYVVSPAVGYNGSAACVPAVVGAASNYDCTSFTNPNPNDPWMSLHTVTRSNRALDVQQQNTTKSAYVFDTLELNPQWLLNMGLRWDDYSAVLTTPSATAAPTVLRNDNNFVNYQAGVVYKPTQNGSIYLSWGTSSTPPGMDGGDGADGITAAIQNLKPQETTNVELGVKWNLFDNQLNLTTAVFHTVMDNARAASDAGTTQNIGKKQVDGIEIGFTGALAKNWSIYGGYTYLDAVLVDNGYVNTGSTTTPVWTPSPNNGNQFPNNARHSATLWTTYSLPFGLTLGGGASYVGKQFGNAANTKWIPGYTRWDAMASYAFNPRYSLQLNVQNLTDKLYFNKPYASHYASIAPGRSATLTFNAKF